MRNDLAMTCPVCHVALQMTERQGIEIDYCPQCRGVWLDRGELDKIVERSYASAPPPQSPPPAPDARLGYDPRQASAPPRTPEYRGDRPRRRDDDEDDDDYRRGGRRKNWLEELFD